MENGDAGNSELYEGFDDSTEEFSSLEEEEESKEYLGDISLLARPIGSNQPYLCLAQNFVDSFNIYDNDFSSTNPSFSYAVGQEIVLFMTDQLGGDVNREKVEMMVSAGDSKYLFPRPYKFDKVIRRAVYFRCINAPGADPLFYLCSSACCSPGNRSQVLS